MRSRTGRPGACFLNGKEIQGAQQEQRSEAEGLHQSQKQSWLLGQERLLFSLGGCCFPKESKDQIDTVYAFNGLQVSKFLEGSYYIFLAQGAQVVRDFFDTVMILYYCKDQLGER